jgi:hypothetical protein
LAHSKEKENKNNITLPSTLCVFDFLQWPFAFTLVLCYSIIGKAISSLIYKKKGELNRGKIRGGSISRNRTLYNKVRKKKKVKTRYNKYESRRECSPNEYISQKGYIL